MKEPPYKWKSFGNPGDPIIAFLAPSNGFAGEAGQKIILGRIRMLCDRGFQVKVPEYADGSLVVEPEVQGREASNRLGASVSPAVSTDVGAHQVIQCIKNRWNIMPLMGGDSFEHKIPLIIQHFETHPEDKKPSVKIFGMSNSTWAAVLASRDICQFISTPFTLVFNKEKTEPNLFSQPAEQLVRLLKGQGIESYPRKILSNPEDKLSNVSGSYHYPLNFGVIFDFAAKRNLLHQDSSQPWSFSLEGFIQRPGMQVCVQYGHYLNAFLEQHKSYPPAFIELGNIATRLDGQNGYANLMHGEAGEILINEYNIDKLYSGREALKKDLLALHQAKQSPKIAERDSQLLACVTYIPQTQAARPSYLHRLLGQLWACITCIPQTQDLTKDDIRQLLIEQNAVQAMLVREIKEVAEHHGIPLIRNTRNGHCANMNIVNGGHNSVNVHGNTLTLKMQNNIEHEAATAIQKLYRGHCVRNSATWIEHLQSKASSQENESGIK